MSSHEVLSEQQWLLLRPESEYRRALEEEAEAFDPIASWDRLHSTITTTISDKMMDLRRAIDNMTPHWSRSYSDNLAFVALPHSPQVPRMVQLVMELLLAVECSHEQKGELFPILLEKSEEELNAFHNNPGSLTSAIPRLLLQFIPAGGVLDPAWGVYVNALSSVSKPSALTLFLQYIDWASKAFINSRMPGSVQQSATTVTYNYAPYTCLVQSSGVGKTKLVLHCRHSTLLIYICLRPSSSSGMPGRSVIANFVDTLKSSETSLCNYEFPKPIPITLFF